MNKIKTFKKSELKSLLAKKNLIEFNRDISDLHTIKMQNSVLECGLLRLPVIGDISAFDSRKYAIIDGQHLCNAIVKMPRDLSKTGKNGQYESIDAIVKVYESKSDVINDIAKLNNTQKTWNDENFLEAWYKFGRDNSFFSAYAYLYNQYNEVLDGLPCGLLIDIYAKDKNLFKEGELEFIDREFSDKVANLCFTLKAEYNKSSFTLHGLRMWAFQRLSAKKTTDWKKLSSRLTSAVRKDEDKNCQKREDFRDFIQDVYTRV